MSPTRDRTNKQTTSEDRATQLLIWETLSLAISFGPKMKKTTALTPICKKCSFVEVSFSTNFRSSWNPANNKTTLNFEFYKWKFETKESINVLVLMIFFKALAFSLRGQNMKIQLI